MKREREKNCYAVTKEREEKKLNLCIFIARNYNSPDKMLLMQRKSSGNLLGFFFFPVPLFTFGVFFPSLSLLLCFVFFCFCSFCFWFSWNLLFVYRWNCSTFDVIPLRTLRGIHRSKIDRAQARGEEEDLPVPLESEEEQSKVHGNYCRNYSQELRHKRGV